MTIKSILLTAFACLAGAILTNTCHCAEDDNPGLSAKEAVHAVLQHGDLSDIDYLSEKFHFGLNTLTPTDYSPSVLVGRFDTNPDYLQASGLTYEADYDDKSDTTRIRLTLPFLLCPNLFAWGEDWGKSVEPGMLTDAGGSYGVLTWDSGSKLSFEVTNYTAGGCGSTLMQEIKGKLAARPGKNKDKARNDGTTLAQAVVDILATGDIRDDEKVADALHANFVFGGYSKGRYSLAKPVPGLETAGFSYWVRDSEWQAPPSFIAEPRHLVGKRARIKLVLDPLDVCLSAATITKALQQGAMHYDSGEKKEDELNISTKSVNLISLQAISSKGCVSAITFEQVTDVADSIASPVIFALDTSLEARDGRLSSSSVAQIDLLMRHIKVPKFSKIDVYENLPKDRTDAQIDKARKLTGFIRDALVARGVEPSRINIYDESAHLPWASAYWENRSVEAGVFLDPIADY